MKKITISSIIMLFCISAFSQDTKSVVYDANAEIRKVDNFTAIEVSNAITLYLSQGNENAVAISGDGSATKEKIKTEVKNGVLKIYVESGIWNKWSWGDKKIKAYVTIKEISQLIASGACSVKITDKLNANNLRVEASGASNIKGELKAASLVVKLRNASTMTLSGVADNIQIDASNASNLKAMDLVANSCSAEASGASSIRINVTKEFSKVHASGASSIHYKGDASVKNFEASGSSSIKKDSSK